MTARAIVPLPARAVPSRAPAGEAAVLAAFERVHAEQIAREARWPITLDQACAGYLGARKNRRPDKSTATRLVFWSQQYGERAMVSLTTDDIRDALQRLKERGAVRFHRAGRARTDGVLVPLGREVAAATINRHLNALASVYKWCAEHRLIDPQWLYPTRGIRKLPETEQHDEYISADEAEQLVTMARAVDQRWRRLPAMILLAHSTGLRRGNIESLQWRHVDLDRGVANIPRGTTKNGKPHTAVLTERVVAELRKLPGSHAPDALVFSGQDPSKKHHCRRLWDKCYALCGLEKKRFHALRHGCATLLAQAGVNQATLMQVMGHLSLRASEKYLHHDVSAKRAAVAKVFG